VGRCFVTVLCGAGPLIRPTAASTAGGFPLRYALCSAASAISVTVLEVLETGSDFTVFCQAVILGLIQAGGLGVLLLTTLLAMLVAGKAGLRLRESAAAEAKTYDLGGVRPMVPRMIGLTVDTDPLVATALFVRLFIHDGEAAGMVVWDAVFHAVSAFNNAGFGLKLDSLAAYATDPLVTGPIAAAIILGGLGYPVFVELVRRYRAPLMWSMTTRAVIIATPVLL